MINKIRNRWSPISLLPSMITDRIGRHDVLLPNELIITVLNLRNFRLFFNQNRRISDSLFC